MKKLITFLLIIFLLACTANKKITDNQPNQIDSTEIIADNLMRDSLRLAKVKDSIDYITKLENLKRVKTIKYENKQLNLTKKTKPYLYTFPKDVIDSLKYFENVFYSPTKLKVDDYQVEYIGYCHTITPNDSNLLKQSPITERQADSLLREDLYKEYTYIKQQLTYYHCKHFTENKIIALAIFAYNIGGERLVKFPIWMNVVRNKDIDNWLLYIYANGKPLKGLLRRRQYELNYFKQT